MSFREKSAWITLVTVLACFGAYFGAIATGRVSARGFDTLHLLLACVVGLVLLVLGLFVPGHLGHTVIDIMNFALLDVVLAVLTVAVAQIIMFRRGA